MDRREMTLSSFVEMIEEMARDIGNGFTAPDEEWMPHAYVHTQNNEMIVVALALDKQFWPGILTTMIAEAKPKFVAVLQECWMLTRPDNEESWKNIEAMRQEGVSYEFIPGRVEQLMLIGYDQEQVIARKAEIVRSRSDPPQLAVWSSLVPEGASPDSLTGAQIDPVRDAMRAVPS